MWSLVNYFAASITVLQERIRKKVQFKSLMANGHKKIKQKSKLSRNKYLGHPAIDEVVYTQYLYVNSIQLAYITIGINRIVNGHLGLRFISKVF